MALQSTYMSAIAAFLMASASPVTYLLWVLAWPNLAIGEVARSIQHHQGVMPPMRKPFSSDQLSV